MRWIKWLVITLAFVEGGWLAFDGATALVTGDYITPRSGEYAGQLGPWSKLVEKVGLDPRSTLVKSLHVGIGSTWLAVMACFAADRPWAHRGMRICAAAGLWYLPFGTLLSVVQLLLLRLAPRHKR